MALYSKTARTRAMYAVRLLLMGHLRIFRLRKPSVLFAFLVIVEMCECHFKSLDMVMPRYGLVVTYSRVSLFRL